MEITGKIIAVLPAREGVSQRTGNAWKMQEYVIETHDTYPKKCCFNIFGAEKISQFNIQLGEELTVSFDIDAREYQGKYYNDIRAWAINRNVQVPGAAPVPGADGVAPAGVAAAAAPAPEAPFPPQQPAAEGGSSDDLPF